MRKFGEKKLKSENETFCYKNENFHSLYPPSLIEGMIMKTHLSMPVRDGAEHILPPSEVLRFRPIPTSRRIHTLPRLPSIAEKYPGWSPPHPSMPWGSPCQLHCPGYASLVFASWCSAFMVNEFLLKSYIPITLLQSNDLPNSNLSD